MLKILERKITLQLLVFYSLFILPLLLGGIELYVFQRDNLQQSFQGMDRGLAQSIALEIEANGQPVSADQLKIIQQQANCNGNGQVVSTPQPTINQQQLNCNENGQAVSTPQPTADQQQANCNENGQAASTPQPTIDQQQVNCISIWIIDEKGRVLTGIDEKGRVLTGTSQQFTMSPILKQDFKKDYSDSLIVRAQGRDWSYSFVSVKGMSWKVVVGRPVDVMLIPVISFQRSLIIALITLVIGATLFWFAMHGWVIAPLSRLAQAVKMIKPDQTEKVTESKLIARERNRIDEIGQLIAAFSTMEDEMQDLFRKSDKESQARLHTLDAIMQSMNEGVLLESPEGEIVYANRSFTQFVGISSQELIPDSFNVNHLSDRLLEMMENPEAYREALQQTEQDGGLQTIEFQARGYYNQVGQLVPVRRDIRVRHFEVRDREGQLIGRGKIFNDVTRQNEAERVKKHLLAIVSHELRTPLTVIKGYATNLLATDVKWDAAMQERFLGRIVEEGDRMADLVTNLLEMSQLEAGTLKLNPGQYRLDVMIEQITSEDERHHIQASIPADLPLLYVDRRRIEMVLRNLIENARRYGGPEANIEIAARYEQGQTDDGLHISVTDNGPGLPEHLTERIFDHFYQIDGSRERSNGGVGLGLAICRGFIEAHGGRIWAENRADGTTGAIFHIWLPARVLRTSTAQQSIFDLHNAL